MESANLHWRYFVSLEEDLIKLTRFIEFSEDNLNVYSIEIVRLFLSTCSEIDAVLKLICEELSPDEKPKNINKYFTIIEKSGFIFESDVVNIRSYKLNFSPWIKWSEDKSPEWWKKYNAVKHDRSKNYHQATLNNLLNAISALFISIYYLYKLKNNKIYPCSNTFVDRLFPQPQLLKFPDGFRYSHLGCGH